MGFHGGVNLTFRSVCLLQNDVRFAEPLLHISPFVLIRLCEITSLADLRNPGIQGLLFVHRKGKNSILNLDGPQCIPCLVRRFSGNSSNGLSLEPAMGIEESFLDVVRIRPFHICQRIGIVYDGADPGHLFRFAQIQPLDDGIRIGAPKNGPIKGIG